MTHVHVDVDSARKALADQGAAAPVQTIVVAPMLAAAHSQMARLYCEEGRGSAALSFQECVRCLKDAGSTATNPSTTFRHMVQAGLLSESGERSNRYRVPIVEGICVQATGARGHANIQTWPEVPMPAPVEQQTQARPPSERMQPALEAIQAVFAGAVSKQVSSPDLFTALKNIGWERPAEATCYLERSGHLRHVSGTKKSRRDPPYFELVDGRAQVDQVPPRTKEAPTDAQFAHPVLRSREALVEELGLLDKELERASQAEVTWREAPTALMQRLKVLQAELDAARMAYEAHVATPDPKIEIQALEARRTELQTVIQFYPSFMSLVVS